MSSLRDIKIEGKSNPAEFNIAQCLLANEWIDHDHPDIIKKAKELTDGIEDEWEKVIAIFEFINSPEFLDQVKELRNLILTLFLLIGS